ncbi:C4-dicarboxylate ABC transporter [Floricoccus tropicus]|uniref:C4-dicarboxylate ABC transporter n=1 Tax=Floricoccus tropicus TaxID=1859473 RepID=A0A1E8GK99_9LACT|nr:TDT family transporter [Floricoccus tropicus]OFI48607.1 C4-dicarboxylate ABC transporter [Floricoccus tropicus]
MIHSFKEFLKRIPIPICGLILGTVSLGNLLYSINYHILGNIFCILGCLLMVLVVLKIIFTMDHTLKAMKDPIVASVSPTFTMALMVIAAFLTRVLPLSPLVQVIWLFAVILHFALMVFFVAVHVFPEKLSLENIYPSWFITFVGMGVIPNTSNLFIQELGQITIWLALILYLLLLPILIKRVVFMSNMPDSAMPLVTIMTAPGSLCLAGYLSVTTHPCMPLVVFLLVLSQLIYFLVVANFSKLLQKQFYPSYAAFTFPMVITATAITRVKSLFTDKEFLYMILNYLSVFEVVIAILIVLYVLYKYLVFLRQQLVIKNRIHVLNK